MIDQFSIVYTKDEANAFQTEQVIGSGAGFQEIFLYNKHFTAQFLLRDVDGNTLEDVSPTDVSTAIILQKNATKADYYKFQLTGRAVNEITTGITNNPGVDSLIITISAAIKPLTGSNPFVGTNVTNQALGDELRKRDLQDKYLLDSLIDLVEGQVPDLVQTIDMRVDEDIQQEKTDRIAEDDKEIEARKAAIIALRTTSTAALEAEVRNRIAKYNELNNAIQALPDNSSAINTNTTNIATNAKSIVDLSAGAVQSNVDGVARLGGEVNTLKSKVFTQSQNPNIDDVDNILTNKNAIAKNKAAIAATPSLVAHDAKEDKILRLTSSPNSPVAPSIVTTVPDGYVNPIYSTRVDFTSMVYNSTPPSTYSLALTEAPSLRIVEVGNNPPPADAVFFPAGSLYITADSGRVAADVPQTITLTFPNTVVTYTRPVKHASTITIAGPHFSIVLERYDYNFSGTAHALIPVGIGGVITTTGGKFEIDDMDVVEGNEGQRIIQVSVDNKLDIIWEKETTGVVADWFQLSTVGLDVAANTKGIAKNKADIAALPSGGGTSSGDKEDKILQISTNPNGDLLAVPVKAGTSDFYSSSATYEGYIFHGTRYPIVIAKPAINIVGRGASVPSYLVITSGGTAFLPASANRTAQQVPQTITFTGSGVNVVFSNPVKNAATVTSIETGLQLEYFLYTKVGDFIVGGTYAISSSGGDFLVSDTAGVLEGKVGQKAIQVKANKKLDILWQKTTTGVLADWFKLYTPTAAAGSSKFVDLTDTEATVGNTDDIMTTKASGLIGPAPLVVHESNLDAGLQKHFLTPRAPVTLAKGKFDEDVLFESYVGHGRSKKRATATQDSAYKSASAAFPLDTSVVLSTKMSSYIRTNDIRKAGDFWGDAYAIYNGSFWSGQYGDVKRAIRGTTPSNPTPQRVAESALDNAGYTTMAVHDETLWVASAYPGAHTRVNNADRYALTTKVKRILNNTVITGYVKVDVPYGANTQITSGVIAATHKYLWVFSQLGERVIYTRVNPDDITIDANGTSFTFNNVQTGQFFLTAPRTGMKLRFAIGNSRDIYLQFTKQFGTDWKMGTFTFGGLSDNVNYNNSKCGTVTRSDTKGCYKMVDMDTSDTADIKTHAYNTANFKDFPNTNKLIKMAACYSPREFRTFFIVNNTYAYANREAIAYTTALNSASLNPLKGIPGTNASFAVPIGSLLYVLIRNYDAARTKVQHAFFTVPIGEIDYSNENYSIQLGDVIYKITVIRKAGGYGIKELDLPGLKVSILSPQFHLDTEIPRSLSVPFLAFGASNFVTVTKLPTIPDNYFFTFNYMFYQAASGGKAEVFETGKVTGLSAGPIKIMRDTVQNLSEVNMRTPIAANAREAQTSYGHNAKNFYLSKNTASIIGLKTNIDNLKDKTVVIQWEPSQDGAFRRLEIDSNLLRTFVNFDSTTNAGENYNSSNDPEFLNRKSNNITTSALFSKKGKIFDVASASVFVFKRRHDQIMLGLAYGDFPSLYLYNLKVFYKDSLATPAFPSGTDRGLEITISSGEILAYTVKAGGNTGPGVFHINNFTMTKN